MKAFNLAAALLLCAATLWAQSTAPQTPPATAQGETGAGSAKSTQAQPAPRAGKGMAGMQGMQQMHQQHMQEAKATLERMHALLNSMRSSYTSMNPKDQPAMQANIEMWQLMLSHLDQMVQHMESMGPGAGPGMMMQHRHGQPGNVPPKPPSPNEPGTPPPPPPQL